MHWPHSPAPGGHGLMVEPDWSGGWGALEKIVTPAMGGVPLAHGLATFALVPATVLLLLSLCLLFNNTNPPHPTCVIVNCQLSGLVAGCGCDKTPEKCKIVLRGLGASI